MAKDNKVPDLSQQGKPVEVVRPPAPVQAATHPVQEPVLVYPTKDHKRVPILGDIGAKVWVWETNVAPTNYELSKNLPIFPAPGELLGPARTGGWEVRIDKASGSGLIRHNVEFATEPTANAFTWREVPWERRDERVISRAEYKAKADAMVQADMASRAVKQAEIQRLQAEMAEAQKRLTAAQQGQGLPSNPLATQPPGVILNPQLPSGPTVGLMPSTQVQG